MIALILLMFASAASAGAINEELVYFKLQVATWYASSRWEILTRNGMESRQDFVEVVHRNLTLHFERIIRTQPNETVIAYDESLSIVSASHQDPLIEESIVAIQSAVEQNPGQITTIESPFPAHVAGAYVDGMDIWIAIVYWDE